MVLIGFLLGLWYAMRVARRNMLGRKAGEPGLITPEHIYDFAIMALFVAIVGARLLYVALDWWEFKNHPLDIFMTWTGGLSIHGSIISGIAFLFYYCRLHKLSPYRFADYCAPSFALGYAIGRIGCFINGCCYGAPCHLPWACRFLDSSHPSGFTPPSHPTQLYATAMNLCFFAFLHRYLRRPHKDCELFYSYLALYSVYRFIDEGFRKGATADVFILGMTHAQVFCLITLPFYVYGWLSVRKSTIG